MAEGNLRHKQHWFGKSLIVLCQRRDYVTMAACDWSAQVKAMSDWLRETFVVNNTGLLGPECCEIKMMVGILGKARSGAPVPGSVTLLTMVSNSSR